LGGLIAWLSTQRAGTVERPTIGLSRLGRLRLAEATETDG